jgi:hypothetical protein
VPEIFLTVEDVFDIKQRGLIVVPGPLQAEYDGPREFPVLLKIPGGSDHHASLTLEHMFQSPPPKEYRWVCMLRGVTKADVPIGTQVWTIDT